MLLNSFVYSNFNCSSLVWHFCSVKYKNELLEYFKTTFPVYDYESILNKSGKSTMEVKRSRTLALEVFKTVNNMNPG